MLTKIIYSVTAEISTVPLLPSIVKKNYFFKVAFDLFRELSLFGLLCALFCYIKTNLESIAQNQHLLAAKQNPVCYNCGGEKICAKR